MTGVELLALGEKAAGKAAFSKFAAGTLSKLKGAVQSASRSRKNARAISTFFTQVSKVRLVKTLWQIDKPVDIGTFYCESHIELNGTRKKITSAADFKGLGNLLIEGIAGQGKSIFLRYLCGVELVRAEYIPIFVELRRVRKGASLLESVLSCAAEFGLKLMADEFQDLAATGRVLLLLDAFDEVPEDDKPHMVDQIEHLARCNESLRIFLSSRPHSGMEVSAAFQVVKLSDLQGKEYETVIFRLLEDQKIAGELIKQVRAHRGAVEDLLKTPLLVTLLVINYKSFQEVPAELSGFYDSLFKLLLQRHDGTKPGYRRQRLCALNDSEYRMVFEAFCYLAKQYREASLSHKMVYDAARKALSSIDSKEDAEKYVSDIVKITCLLVKDGEEYRFIHKSVHEYYAACFIKARTEKVAETIYSKIFLGSSFQWRQELNFLSEIDAYRFNKFGVVPWIAKYLKTDVQSLANCAPGDVQETIFEHICKATIYFSTKGDSVVPYGVACDHVPTLNFVQPFFDVNYSAVIKAVNDGIMQWERQGADERVLTCSDAVRAGVMVDEFHELALRVATRLLEIARKALLEIKAQEKVEFALVPLI